MDHNITSQYVVHSSTCFSELNTRRSWITHPYDVYFSLIYLFSVCELTRLQYQSKGLLHLHVCKVHVV